MTERITIEDNSITVLMKMADGNPGAITALMDIMQGSYAIDPGYMMGGMGAIMMLDAWGIYGTNIYILWNDKCDRDLRRFVLLMQATRLGLFSKNKLIEMSNDQSRQIDVTDEEWQTIDDGVCEQLVDFQRP